MKQWKEEKYGTRGGGGKTLNEPLHRPLHKHSTKKLADPSRVQSYHVPCEPALMGLTAGCPLSSWTTFKTAKLVNRLTAKLVDHLTSKLVVVNLVKLHLTKFNI